MTFPWKPLPLYRYALYVAVLWTCIVGLSCYWNMHELDADIKGLAQESALTGINKDVAMRTWVASHGGVYVPATDKTPPNPNLSHIPERDIVGPNGTALTLMNPAYVMRQFMSDFHDEFGVMGHLTSLKPLRPDNAPDPWERKALEAFQAGARQVEEFTEINGEPYLRLIRPFVVTSDCLKCHAHQGYVEGDIRGGISTAIPLKPYIKNSKDRYVGILATHALLWVVGLLGISFGARHMLSHDLRRRSAEDELSEREEFLRAIVNHNPECLVVLEADCSVVSANPAATALLGIAPLGEAGARNFLESISPECRQDFRELIDTVRKDCRDMTMNITVLSPSVGLRHVEVCVVPLRHPRDGHLHFLLVGRDITESLSSQEALRISEARLAKAQSLAHLGNWEWDMEANTLYWSEEVYRIFGLAPRQFGETYEAFLNTIHPDDRQRVIEAVDSAIKGKGHYSVDHQVVRPDGSVRAVHEEGHVIFGEGGKPVHMSGTVHDITELKLAEQALVRSRDFSLKLLDELPNPIWRVRAGGRQDYFNKAWLNFTGRTLGEVIETGWATSIHPDDLPVFDQLFNFSLANQKPYALEYRLWHHSGEHRWVMDYGIPFYDLDGTFFGLIGACYDIDDRKRMEDDLRAALDEKVLLLQEVHHRVNNNMQIITSLLKLEVARIKDPSTSEFLTDTQGRLRTIALVHQSLYHSQDLSNINFKEYLETLSRALYQAYNKDPLLVPIDIQVDVETFSIDIAIPIGLLINELLTNALKHAFPTGGPGAISLSIKESGPGRLTLTVQDNGKGIGKPVDMDSPTTLGFTLVHMLVRQLRGKATVEPIGKGTRITVEFEHVKYRKRF